MRTSLSIYGLLAALVFTLGCATAIPVQNLADLPELKVGATGIALPVRMNAVEGFVTVDRCHLSVRDLGVKQGLYEIGFQSGSSVVFAELPPGTYAFKEMGCGPRMFNLVFKEWPAFTVYPGKISISDGLGLKLLDTQTASIKHIRRTENREQFLAFFGRIPAEARSRVVSAYGGFPIDASSVKRASRYEKWFTYDEKGKEIAGSSELWQFFEDCYEGESAVNGLWLGDVAMDAEFRDGKLKTLKTPESWSTFTNQFKTCVSARVKEFQPAAKKSRRYVLYL